MQDVASILKMAQWPTGRSRSKTSYLLRVGARFACFPCYAVPYFAILVN